MSADEETGRTGIENRLVFLDKAKIKYHSDIIDVPEDADLLRTKGGYVKFYKGNEPEGNANGWSDILEGAVKVFFPDYRPTTGGYGKPAFKQKG